MPIVLEHLPQLAVPVGGSQRDEQPEALQMVDELLHRHLHPFHNGLGTFERLFSQLTDEARDVAIDVRPANVMGQPSSAAISF